MEDREQTQPDARRQDLRFTCPTCKRRVHVRRQDPSKLPAFFPFCSERCKLIDLGAWLDAAYRIPSKPEEEPDHPTAESPPADPGDSHP